MSRVQCVRVAFVNSDLWLGGGTVFMLNLCDALIRRGIPAKAFCMGEPHSMREDFEKAGIPLSLASRQGILEDRLLALYQSLREFSPTAVVINAGVECEIFRVIPPSVKRIAVGHTLVPQLFDMVSLYASHCDAIVGVSESFTREMSRRLGCVKTPRLATIELGVPLPDNPKADLDQSGPIRILYLGRLEDQAKRVLLFPGIYDQLVASGIPFSWTIAGEGPEKPFLEKAMPSLSPNQHVHFVGRIPYNEVPLLLQQHDVILLTSSTESFPLSLHEAMAFGLIPVVSDIPGRVREVVSEDVGLRVPIDQPENFVPSIKWLHDHREVWPRMKKAARERISAQYSVAAMADRWLDFLQCFTSDDNEAPWVVKPRIPPPVCFNSPFFSSPLVRFLRRIGKKALRRGGCF